MPFAAISGCNPGQSPNGDTADATLNVVSHEHNETITDPLGTAWFDSSGNENGDECNFTFGAAIGNDFFGSFNQIINGHFYWLQEEWSNRANSCQQRNNFVQPTASFTVSPASPVHGSAATFTSTVSDSDDTSFTYSWSFGDFGTSTLKNPTHTYSTAGSKNVTLIVTDANGDQVKVTKTISVS
jgi:PKD repeat protein